MGVWRDQVLPRLTDLTLRGADVGQLRAAACAGLSGRVLEIGFGSGRNVPFYPAEVEAVDAVEPRVVAWQRRLEPVQRRVTGGCHLTRDVPALLTDAGFQMTDLSAAYVPGPASARPWGFVYRGRATA